MRIGFSAIAGQAAPTAHPLAETHPPSYPPARLQVPREVICANRAPVDVSVGPAPSIDAMAAMRPQSRRNPAQHTYHPAVRACLLLIHFGSIAMTGRSVGRLAGLAAGNVLGWSFSLSLFAARPVGEGKLARRVSLAGHTGAELLAGPLANIGTLQGLVLATKTAEALLAAPLQFFADNLTHVVARNANDLSRQLVFWDQACAAAVLGAAGGAPFAATLYQGAVYAFWWGRGGARPADSNTLEAHLERTSLLVGAGALLGAAAGYNLVGRNAWLATFVHHASRLLVHPALVLLAGVVLGNPLGAVAAKEIGFVTNTPAADSQRVCQHTAIALISGLAAIRLVADAMRMPTATTDASALAR